MSPMKPKPDHQDDDVAGSLSLTRLARRWAMTEKQLRAKMFTGKVNFMQICGRFRVSRREIKRIESELGRPPRFE